jgi:hypothetical protein
MTFYRVPPKCFLRLHHVRPRFKNNVENVILYVASLVTQTGVTENDLFRKIVLKKLKEFPGNANLAEKTLHNWRTEISALFGLYYEDEKKTYPSPLALNLNDDQDLSKFFKYFLYSFQYPGGHVKLHEIQHLVNEGVCFNPSRYFLNVLFSLEKLQTGQGYLTKGEACHMIFNDKRATCDPGLQNVEPISKTILINRKNKVQYDLSGDVIRYAGDILDYLVLANLLKDYAGKFFINKTEKRAIDKFLSKNNYFKIEKVFLKDANLLEKKWVEFCSEAVVNKVFSTDVLAFIAKDEKEYKELQNRTNYIAAAEIPGKETRTKDIGDYGENVVYGHECTFLKLNKREDLIQLVKCIPNHFAVGYDIQSVGIDEIKKYIEVKSTISSKKLTFNKFHLTKNELSSAQTLKENYYVYRLQIIKGEKAEDEPELILKIIKNPIQLFKNELIDIDLTTGEVSFGRLTCEDVKVLKWS